MSDSQSKQLSDVMDRAMTATMRASKQAEIADQELEAKIRTLKADIMTCKRRMSAAANGPSGKALVERLKTLQRELDEMNATLLQHEGKRMATKESLKNYQNDVAFVKELTKDMDAVIGSGQRYDD